MQKCENAWRNLAEFLECGADAFFLVFRLESQGAEVSAQFLIAESEQSALCTFFSLLPKAYDEPPLVVAVFHFPGFAAALPCRVGRLLLSFRVVFLARAATLKKWLLVVFRLDSNATKVCKFCRFGQELSNEYLVFTCNNWRRYSRERASQSLLKMSHKSEKSSKKHSR